MNFDNWLDSGYLKPENAQYSTSRISGGILFPLNALQGLWVKVNHKRYRLDLHDQVCHQVPIDGASGKVYAGLLGEVLHLRRRHCRRYLIKKKQFKLREQMFWNVLENIGKMFPWVFLNQFFIIFALIIP